MWDLADHPLALYVLLSVAFVALLVATSCSMRVSVPVVLGVALLLRLPLLAVPASLSNDVLRYVWDGRVVVSGMNPYALAPDAPALAHLRDGAWIDMSHRDVETVYPPAAMILFSIAALAPRPVRVLKVMLVVLELVGCGLLVLLARRLQVPTSWTLWYAWNPLAVLEGAGMGHVDGAGATATIAVVLLLCRRSGETTADPRAASRIRAAGAAIAAACGVLLKLVPAICVPMWARQSGAARRFLAVAGGLVAAGTLPVLVSVGGLPRGLVRYGVAWEFNGPLYEPLWRLCDLLAVPAITKLVLDGLKWVTGLHELISRAYPFVYPQLLAKGMLALVLLAWVLRTLDERDVVVGTRRLLGGGLLLTATFYPWYLLWVLPWAALTRSRPWLVLSASVLFAYLPELVGLRYFPWVYLMVWIPFALAAWWQARAGGAGSREIGVP